VEGTSLEKSALLYLRRSLADPTATFRQDQWEAIDGLVERNARLLVVQRTGWGKSVVYFMATRLLRDRGAGPTILISPLLALMRNQIVAAERLDIRAATINSNNPDEWDTIRDALTRNEIDILLISPERLGNDDFRMGFLAPIASRIGLLVVDEAHCISDWGHDFRPDYKRITRVLQALPRNVPVVCTTTTANDRVVNDIVDQLGASLEVIRGPLERKSLRLQTIHLPNQAARMAWIAEHIPELPGSGIIYTLTVKDAQRLAGWLQQCGIDAEAYWGGLDAAQRVVLEQRLIENGLKAVVATTVLGMGFDKPDLGFVIHFQRPGSIIHYYQQIGRAGRELDEAYVVLLSGSENQDIIDYFIKSAFPPEGHAEQILDVLMNADQGLSVRDIVTVQA
jgi:ATP-dependent DNA helicase RecQ